MLNYEVGYEPWLAESLMGNQESTEFTLKIKEGITWNDGKKFTTDDVIFTIEMFIANDSLNGHFFWVEWLDSIEKIDELTLIFN